MGFLLYISYHGAFIYSYGILLYGCIPSGLVMAKIKDYDLITVDEHRIVLKFNDDYTLAHRGDSVQLKDTFIKK